MNKLKKSSIVVILLILALLVTIPSSIYLLDYKMKSKYFGRIQSKILETEQELNIKLPEGDYLVSVVDSYDRTTRKAHDISKIKMQFEGHISATKTNDFFLLSVDDYTSVIIKYSYPAKNEEDTLYLHIAPST